MADRNRGEIKAGHVPAFLLAVRRQMQNNADAENYCYNGQYDFLCFVGGRTVTVFACAPAFAHYQIPRQGQHCAGKYKNPWFHPVRNNMKVCGVRCNQADD